MHMDMTNNNQHNNNNNNQQQQKHQNTTDNDNLSIDDVSDNQQQYDLNGSLQQLQQPPPTTPPPPPPLTAATGVTNLLLSQHQNQVKTCLNSSNMSINESIDNINNEKMELVNSTENLSAVQTVTEDGSRAEATFQFTITDFSKFKEGKESRLSPACIVRNLPWKILAMIKPGSNRDESNKMLGFFLQCNAESESTRWSVCAVAELRLLHQTDPNKNYVKKIQHIFYVKENDWGYSPFIPIKDIMDLEKGYYNPANDSITLEVWVNADAPHGTAWDSKKLTGFVGLTNQGATCYMNSLLQTLFFTNKLRNAVYLMPTENDDPTKSVPLALQRVFYDLQFSEKSVGTKKLTRSFGWETLDTFMQHDVQELCRVLLDNIENKMKHTNVDGIIPKLFEGKMISYVKCKQVVYESRRVECFYDIQLNIKGKKDIYESFKDYVTVETLDGENKYDAGKYGLQEAQKGVVFEKFPPVLHLHLMRFQYDPQTDSNIKINDRYEFFEKIDLDEFLEKTESTPAKYTLHAVLVHSGDNHGGHYVVFINPNLDNNWFKFDDEVVSRCNKKDAVMNNFGGNSDDITFRHSTNAYMLVYIRDSCRDDVLCQVNKTDIPNNLHERLLEEKRLEAIKKREKNEAPNYMQLNIILEDEFYKNDSSDLYDVNKIDSSKTLKVRKLDTVQKVKQTLSETFNCPIEALRMWPIFARNNNTTRPASCIDCEECLNKSIFELAKQDVYFKIYLEISEFDNQTNKYPPLQPYNSKDDVLLFFKYYEPATSTLKYVFHMYFPATATLAQVEEKINNKMKFPPNTELIFYEEVRLEDIKLLKYHDFTLEKIAEQQLLDGDIYVFQINDKDKCNSYKLPTVIDYFKDLSNKIEVNFCDKNQPNDDGFDLKLSLIMKYDEFAKAVAQHLNWDYLKLQFFRSNGTMDIKPQVNNAIKYNPDISLNNVLGGGRSPMKRLYYQKLNLKINELEERKQFKCIFQSINPKIERELVLFPHKKSLVKDLFNECKTLLIHNSNNELLATNNDETTANGNGLASNNVVNSTLELQINDMKLRMVEIFASKISKTIKDDSCADMIIDQSQASKTYRIEQIQDDELKLNPDELLLPIAHFSKEIYNTFGSPFLLKIKNGEPFKDIKKRIQRRLDVNDKEFSTYRFSLMLMGNAHSIPENDDEYIFQIPQSVIQPWLGIDHANKAANRNKSRYSTFEKPIKIFN